MWKHDAFGIKREVHGMGRDNDGFYVPTVISPLLPLPTYKVSPCLPFNKYILLSA